jgi:hypothetical protein
VFVAGAFEMRAQRSNTHTADIATVVNGFRCERRAEVREGTRKKARANRVHSLAACLLIVCLSLRVGRRCGRDLSMFAPSFE